MRFANNQMSRFAIFNKFVGFMRKLINIDSGDIVTSVIDKLISEKAKNIFLFIPSNALFWHSIVNLKLLKREAGNLNKNIIIINSDRVKRELSERVGFVSLSAIPEEIAEEDAGDYKIEDSLEDILLSGGKKQETNVAPVVAPKKISDIIRLLPDKGPALSSFASLKKYSSHTNAEEERGELSDEDDRILSGIKKDITKNEDSRDIYETSADMKKNKLEEEFFDRENFEEHFNNKAKNVPSQKIFGGTKNDAYFSESMARKMIKKRVLMKGIIFPLLIVIASASLAGMAIFILPKAELHIFRKLEPVPFDVAIAVDSTISAVDFERNKIPGQILTVRKTEEKLFLSSGEKEIEEKARGLVTVYNELDSTSQPMIPSRFQEEKTGKIFWSKKSVIVPGASIKDGKILPGTLDVEIVASEAGSDFNINCSAFSPCRFTIPAWQGTVKYDKLYAVTNEPIKGGSIGKVKVATIEDIAKAREVVVSNLKSELTNELNEKVPSNLQLLKESFVEKIIKESAGVKVGDVADDFLLSADMELSGVAFNEEDFNRLFDFIIKNKMSEDMDMLADKREVSFAVSYGADKKVLIKATGEESVAWKIDELSIKRDVLKKNESDLRQYFNSIKGVESVRVDFWPFWVDKTPNKESRIEIIIER